MCKIFLPFYKSNAKQKMVEIILTSTITQKGQITIPKTIRVAFELKTNDKVVFVRRGNDIILKPLRDVLTLRGSVKVDVDARTKCNGYFYIQH